MRTLRLSIAKKTPDVKLTNARNLDAGFPDYALSPAVAAQLAASGVCVWPEKGLTLIDSAIDLVPESGVYE